MANPPAPGAQRFDVFLSYNSADRPDVVRIAQRLKRAGIEPWLDQWSLTPGGDWQRELGAGLDASLACAIFVGPNQLGAWEGQEIKVAIDRGAKDAGFRVFPVLLTGVQEGFDPNELPHFLRARTWVDFRRGRDDERALQHLINAIKGVPFGHELPAATTDDVAPYRGLQAFGEEDARLFFGRDREVQRLLEKLKNSRFLAVLGPSGSGKSSLVRAGLVPALRAGGLAQDGDWHVRMLRPGAAPLTALAAQLAKLAPDQPMHATLDRLAGDERTLHLSVEQAFADKPPGERALVLVDQLEEVFTLCRDEAERRRLFATLLHASAAPGGRTVVIVTMRADFYGRCAAYPEFAQLVASQQMLVGPMDGDGLRQAIEEPARRVGLELEQGLSETILRDVAAEPGALPLLEHALLELWERRRGTMLTLEGYRETGGVQGALAQRADEIIDALSPAQQEIARRALLRLTEPGEGTEDTRRRAPRSELEPAGAGDSFDAVLGRLVDARMLTTGRDEGGREVVDVSHEALIRAWPRLRGWIDADRSGLLIHRRLTDAASEWLALDHEPGALYRGARLATAGEWAADHGDDLSQVERDFLAASEAVEHSELDAAKRRARRLRALAGGLAALTAIVVVVAIWAWHQRGVAQQRQAQATSLALASAATTVLDSRPDVALLLALEASRADPAGVDGRSATVAALTTARAPGLVGILHGLDDAVYDIALSRDGRTLASGGADKAVRLWDARSHRQLGPPLRGHTGAVGSVAFSPDGRTLASGSDDHTIRLWDVRARKQAGRPLEGHSDAVLSVTFAPDGRTLASADRNGTIRLWDALTRKQLGRPLQGVKGPSSVIYDPEERNLLSTRLIFCLAFSPDGRTLASSGGDGLVRLWNVRRRKAIGRPLEGRRAILIRAVAFSPDGRTLASTDDRTIRLWDARTHAELRPALTGHTAEVKDLAFSSDGRTLASAGDDRTIRVWNTHTHKPIGKPLAGHSGVVTSVAFGPDGTTLASASRDKTIRLWDVRARARLGTPLPGRAGYVEDLAFSPDGRMLASGGMDGTLRSWDARSHKQIGKPLSADEVSFEGVGSLAFSPSDPRILAASGDGTVRLWNMRARKPLGQTLDGQNVAFSPDGRTLATGGFDGTVRLWDAGTRKPLGKLPAHAANVFSVAFSPDGRTLASAGDAATIRLWDVQRRKELTPPLPARAANVFMVEFNPDGRTLASASDRVIRIWDVRTHRQIAPPLVHAKEVRDLAFSPDGRTLASAGDDKTVRLWDAKTHKQLGRPLAAHSDAVRAVAFSPDGRSVASGGLEDGVRLWERILWRNVGELRTEVCRLVGSGLSKAEWSQYASGVPYRGSCP